MYGAIACQRRDDASAVQLDFDVLGADLDAAKHGAEEQPTRRARRVVEDLDQLRRRGNRPLARGRVVTILG